MHEVTDQTIKASLRPYDIVTDGKGNVGIIKEVSVNRSQPEAKNQISYSVEWLIGHNYNSWWKDGELTPHCNMLIKIAEMSCHPFGGNKESVNRFFK